MVATPRERLDAWPSAPALEPSEGKQDERYDERNDGALDVEVRDAAARIDTRWNEPVHDSAGKEHNTKKSGDQRPESVHRAQISSSVRVG